LDGTVGTTDRLSAAALTDLSRSVVQSTPTTAPLEQHIYVSISRCEDEVTSGRGGNSLAIRLPVDCLRAAALKEDDEVEAGVTPAREIRLTVAQSIDKKAFLEHVARLRAGLPMTTATVEEMRRDDRC
jgi:antitoxin MazE